FHLICLSHLLEFFLKTLVRHFDVLCSHDRLEHKSCTDALLSLRLQLFHHLLFRQSCELEVLLKCHALLHDAACKIISHLSCLQIYHRFRKIDLCICNCLLYNLILFLFFCLALFALFELSSHFSLIFFHRLAFFGNVGSELIVKLWKLFHFDRLHSTFEDSLFACKLFRLVFLRECHFHFSLFSDLGTDQLILKARDKRAGSDRQRIVLSLSAFKCSSIYKSLKIKGNLILVLNSPVCHIHCSCIALALFLDLCINFLV